MADKLNETPNANRIHIGFFGKCNSGKSTLVNTLTGQDTSIVSDVPGTTTDAVYKAIELYPLGATVIIDTAGFDDEGRLGKRRVAKTRLAAERADIAVVVFAADGIEGETELCRYFAGKKTPFLALINTFGEQRDFEPFAQKIEKATGAKPIVIDAAATGSREILRSALARLLPEGYGEYDITCSLAQSGDTVLLVMPQDIAAPRGRLILPQVQTIRELLDKRCVTVCVSADGVAKALAALKEPPGLIITDSQVFGEVFAQKPQVSLLTSFSVLFAALKGDIACYVEGAAAIESLSESSRVLIAECCSHAPLEEDIGRVKLPRLLRKRVGEGLTVDFVSGTDYPENPAGYDLIIQCGACMFNRKYVLSRIDCAQNAGVPITNYGVALAYLNGILGSIALP